jgi:AbrB family looped-hinge helix DNA binding protein
MLSRKVSSKGRVTIPKAIRELLGIKEGNDIVIRGEGERIILSKKHNVYEVFSEVAERKGKKLSMKDIKRCLEARYEGT